MAGSHISCLGGPCLCHTKDGHGRRSPYEVYPWKTTLNLGAREKGTIKWPDTRDYCPTRGSGSEVARGGRSDECCWSAIPCWHEDLAYFVQAGLTPMQALQAATRNPAEFLGKLQTQGTIEPGKFADLLLLDANPLDDIHNMQRIRAVLLHGKMLDRKSLDGLLEAEEKFAASH